MKEDTDDKTVMRMKITDGSAKKTKGHCNQIKMTGRKGEIPNAQSLRDMTLIWFELCLLFCLYLTLTVFVCSTCNLFQFFYESRHVLCKSTAPPVLSEHLMSDLCNALRMSELTSQAMAAL